MTAYDFWLLASYLCLLSCLRFEVRMPNFLLLSFIIGRALFRRHEGSSMGRGGRHLAVGYCWLPYLS